MIKGYETAVRLEFHHMVKFRTDTCPWCIHIITLPIVSKLDSNIIQSPSEFRFFGQHISLASGGLTSLKA